MSVDRREAILVRLQQINRTLVASAMAAPRNNHNFSELPRPSIALLDGEETAGEDEPRTVPANAPRRVTMTPGIAILQSGPLASVGSDGNALRAQLLKAYFTDTQLLGLVLDGNSRGIRYHGCGTQFAQGQEIEGQLSLGISFTYPLRIDEL